MKNVVKAEIDSKFKNLPPNSYFKYKPRYKTRFTVFKFTFR